MTKQNPCVSLAARLIDFVGFCCGRLFWCSLQFRFYKTGMILNLTAPTSDDPCPLSGLGLDLRESPHEVAWLKHVHRQRGDAIQHDAILGLAVDLQLLVQTLARREAVTEV